MAIWGNVKGLGGGFFTLRGERRLRIGLILASIHTGSSPTLWKAVHEEAERQGVDLFIFPGGPLEAGELFEKQRNQIYALAGENFLG